MGDFAERLHPRGGPNLSTSSMPIDYCAACCFPCLGFIGRRLREWGTPVETLDVAATPVVVVPSRSRDLGATVAAPSHEPDIARWPGWIRLAILIGGSAVLWGVLAWVAFQILALR